MPINTAQVVVLCLLLPPVSSIVMVPPSWAESIHPLKAKVGGNITLLIFFSGRLDNLHVVWSCCPGKHTLFNFDHGTVLYKESERFVLEESGSLTIQNLSINDTGPYKAEIYNDNGTTYQFNLTVEEPDSTQSPAGQSSNSTTDPRHHWVAVAVAAVAVVVAGTIIGVVKIRGNDRDAARSDFIYLED